MARQPIYVALRALRDELARLNYVIRLLEGLAAGKSHRGRPPKFVASAELTAGSRRPTKRRRRARKSSLP